jgi:hypothetical protein
MPIDWSHLPKDAVVAKVCMSSGGCKRGGFKKDEATGYWVCNGCSKPSVTVAVQECDLCNKVFVPKFYEKVLYYFLGIACDDCEPPSNSNSTG